MLQQLRDASKSMVAVVFIGILILSFAVWGISDIFRTTTEVYLARVGDTTITPEMVEPRVRQRIAVLQAQTGVQLDSEQAYAIGLHREVLDQLIDGAALVQLGERLGIAVSDTLMRSIITSAPEFQGSNGAFDRRAFEARLQRWGFTSEAQYFADFRNALMRQQIGLPLAGAIRPPDALIALVAQHENERRLAEFFVVPEAAAGEITPPDEATLEAFMAENTQTYARPEMRAATVLYVSPEQFVDQIEVSQTEIDSQYAFLAAQGRFGEPERRDLDQITFTSEADAAAARAEIDAGTSFEDVAAARGFGPDDLRLSQVRRGDGSVPEAAFDLEEGAVSQPLEGPFGWVLIRAGTIYPAQQTPEAEAKDEIRRELAIRDSMSRLFEETNQIQDLHAARLPLEEVSAQSGDPLTVWSAVDAQGRGPDGQSLGGPANDPVLLRTLFATDQGQESLLLEGTGGAYFIVRVDGIIPPAQPVFAEVRDRVLADWTAEARSRALRAAAEALAERARGAEPLSAVAESAGAALTASGPLARGGLHDTLSGDTIAALYAAKPGEVIVGRTAGEPVLPVVVRLEGVSTASPEEGAAATEAIARQLSTDMGADIEAALDAYARGQAQITIDEARLARYSSSEPVP